MNANQTIAEILHLHLRQRIQKNSAYSIRAYARDLGLSAAFLSQVMNNKRGLSPSKAEHISTKLQLEPAVHEYLMAQTIISYSRSNEAKTRAQAQLTKLTLAGEASKLKREEFRMISEWFHFAIFQCLFLKIHTQRAKAEGECNYLARILKISLADTEAALKRLSRLQLIKPEGEIHLPMVENITVKSTIPSAAIRKFHRQIIQKSLIAMEAQPVASRFFNTTTLTINQSDLPEIEKDYVQFYQQIVQKYSKKPTARIEATSIYALSTQIFSLSHDSDCA